MQNNQNFLGLHPQNPLKRAYSASPDSPAAQRFFSSLRLWKNQRPKKIAGYGTASSGEATTNLEGSIFIGPSTIFHYF